MDIQNLAKVSTVVINSLLMLLKDNQVDVNSVVMQLSNNENKAISPKVNLGELTQQTLGQLKAVKAKATPQHQIYFSHDFNGDGFKYHNTLDEAQKEALANLEWYQERVADGHHVNEDGNFNELCYGVVIESAGYSVEDIVTEKHHANNEYTQCEVGTEILSLGLYKAKAAEDSQ